MTSPLWRQPDAPDIVRYAKTTCPYCGKPLDAAAVPDSGLTPTPKTGDYAVCFGCAEPSVYEVTPLGVALRAATAQERAQCLAANAETLARLKAFNRRGPGPASR